MQHPLPSWNIILAHHTLQNSSWLQTCLIPASPWDPLQNSHSRNGTQRRLRGVMVSPISHWRCTMWSRIQRFFWSSFHQNRSSSPGCQWLALHSPQHRNSVLRSTATGETLWKVYAGFHTGFLSGGGEDSMLNDSQLRPTKKPHFMPASYIQGCRKQGP